MSVPLPPLSRLRKARWALAAAVGLVGVGAGAWWWPISVPRYADVRAQYVPSEAYLLDRHGQLLDSRRLRFDVRRLPWVPLDQVSPALVSAIVEGEDRRFWQHRGIDWHSVLGTVRDRWWLQHSRGASTITMQLATLLQQRSHSLRGWAAWRGKWQQARMARALEVQWTKPQILEAYLNLLGYRGELQGVGAAAQRLAGKTPAGLSAAESMVLAALLPQPDSSLAAVSTRACARAQRQQLSMSCELLRGTARSMLNSPAPSVDHPAAQVAHQLLHVPGESVVSTLDPVAQRQAQQILRNHLAALAENNVRDGAALVVDNASGEVLAYVGSGGLQSRSEQIDGVRALRQAGSTLKPFLYELAIERGYLTAASILNDSALNLETPSGVYIPQDYDHDFKGRVSIRTALAGSLNVPAVRTLVLVGVEALRDRLNALGYDNIRHDGAYYGYSLALGSPEVSLWEQVQAYRTLARGGQGSGLRLVPSFPTPGRSTRSSATRVLDPAASYIIGDILSDQAARSITFGLDSALDTPYWSAAKTGTSEDMRDNWCIGFSRQFTIGVWVGNFEGDSMQAVSGVSGAAGIWHDLMLALDPGAVATAPAPPPGLSQRRTRFAPALEPPRVEWYVDASAHAVPSSSAGSPAPPSRPAPPPEPQVVAAVSAGLLPHIESPANGVIIALDPDIPAAHQRVLIAVRGAGTALQLKLNGQSIGAAQQRQLWSPRPGAYSLTLEDGAGRALDRIAFTVRGPPEKT